MRKIALPFNGLSSSVGILFLWIFSNAFTSCNFIAKPGIEEATINAKEILGNPAYPAISYGGYRENSREIQPTLEEIKNDLRLLYAMGIRLVRTYNLQFEHAHNVIKAIEELNRENSSFQMYVMLGTWIDCKGARTDQRDHTLEDIENNRSEINKAVQLVNQYPAIVKIISVGNEAMVHWAETYYVIPEIILKWVNHLQRLKKEGDLPANLWITSSDNFASWGGGDDSYHQETLNQLIEEVDYLSIHTYPFHDTHYNKDFWEIEKDINLTEEERIEASMDRALAYAISQYKAVKNYMESLGIDKPIHIGETGWSTQSNGLYGDNGSRAADEYKQALYYQRIQKWTHDNKLTCVYFSAFDEIWKDPNGPMASENNFGLFTVEGKAKYALWSLVNQGLFDGLSREGDGSSVQKTFEGNAHIVKLKSQPPKTHE